MQRDEQKGCVARPVYLEIIIQSIRQVVGALSIQWVVGGLVEGWGLQHWVKGTTHSVIEALHSDQGVEASIFRLCASAHPILSPALHHKESFPPRGPHRNLFTIIDRGEFHSRPRGPCSNNNNNTNWGLPVINESIGWRHERQGALAIHSFNQGIRSPTILITGNCFYS